MSIINKSAAFVAATVAFATPAVAQTQRGVPVHRDLSFAFSGLVEKGPSSSCPNVHGVFKVQADEAAPAFKAPINFNGKIFEKTGDRSADEALAEFNGLTTKMCAGPLYQNIAMQDRGEYSVFVQLRAAFDATVMPKKDGCSLTDGKVNLFIDSTVAGKTFQKSLPTISLPEMAVTQKAGKVVLSVQGQELQSLPLRGRELNQMLASSSAATACRLSLK